MDLLPIVLGLCLILSVYGDNSTDVSKSSSTEESVSSTENEVTSTGTSYAEVKERSYNHGSSGYGSVQEAVVEKYPSYSDYKPNGYRPSGQGAYKPHFSNDQSSSSQQSNGGWSNQNTNQNNYNNNNQNSYNNHNNNKQWNQQPSSSDSKYWVQQTTSNGNKQWVQQSSNGNKPWNQQSSNGNKPWVQQAASNGNKQWVQQSTNDNKYGSQLSSNEQKYWAQQSSHNHQQVANLNECSSQQACSAIFLRMNYTHRLCNCPRSSGSCSESRDAYDGYTMELPTRPIKRKVPMTLLKTCQPLSTLRPCRHPKDWSLLALQNTRSGKAQYLVTCRCPNWASLEGPVAHENPSYADIPGIRVYGMLCWSGTRGSRFQIKDPAPDFPWEDVIAFAKTGKV